MATKRVEMAVRDPKTKQLVVDEVEVETHVVNVRNRDAIGRRLRAEYNIADQPVPERLAALLKELKGRRH